MVMEESWEVVGDTYCNSRLLGVTEPDERDDLSGTKFLMDIKAIIRRLAAQRPADHFDVDMLLTEKNWSVEEDEATIEFQYDDVVSAMKSISDALSVLLVPIQTHSSLVDRILFQASNAANNCDEDRKVLHMAVVVDLYVAEKIWD